MAENIPGKTQRQKQAAIRLVLMAAILICVNVLASYIHAGLDLTKEKRFSLTEPTKKLLRNMNEVAVIDVYLKGKFPAELQRMQEAVRERLSSFKAIAGNKIVFRFIDPLEGKNDKEQKLVVHDLENKGIRALELRTQDEDEYSMKVFFPWALVQYNGKEMPVYLLGGGQDRSTAEDVSYAEVMLEYKFASALNQLNKPQKTKVAYVIGNEEEYGMKTLGMLLNLPRFYALDTIDINHTLSISSYYDAIIINQPKVPFTGPQKLKIDQYVMNGGHVLWVVNSLRASLDSLRNSPQFIGLEYNLDLDDMLYKYGLRVNNDMLEDMQCAKLPRTYNNGKPELRDWIYFPLFNPTSDHPIVRNMALVMGQFTNTIDTIRATGIKKTILLQSSKYSRTAHAPVRVSLTMMNYPMKTEMFNKPYLPVAVLLEGQFHSVYKGRLAPEYLHLLDSLKVPFKPVCDKPTSQIVISVGDIFSSGYSAKDGILPIGYYSYTGQYFANRDFLLNCMEYLTDNSGILEARAKDVKMRLLDTGRARDEKNKWQVINVAVPIVMVLVFASAFLFYRKRRYENK